MNRRNTIPKVLCTLPNASEEIGGIKFDKHANGMLSEDVSDEQAARLASIDGYAIVGEPAPVQAPDPAKADERAALLAQAEVIGLKVKGNWSNERLNSEIAALAKPD